MANLKPLLPLLLLSCTSPSKKTADKKASASNCYRYTTPNKDTVILKLVPVGDSITGTLDYYYFGKGRQEGTIRGYSKNGVIIADYIIKSGGVESWRPVAFKKTGNDYIEGAGGVKIVVMGQMQFDNPDSLQFFPNIVYKAFECNEK